MTDAQLYNAIWDVIAQYVRDIEDTNDATDKIWDLILDDARETAIRRSYDQTAGFMVGSMYPFK